MGSSTWGSTNQLNRGATRTASSYLTNAANFGSQGLSSALSDLSNYSGTDSKYWNSFMSQAGDLQGLVVDAQSGLQKSLSKRAGELATEATNSAASNLAGLGGLYSGATLEAAGKASAGAFADVANQLGAQSINLYGGLLGGAMQGAQQASTNDLNALLGGVSAYGGIYSSALSGLTGLGAPQYTSQANPWYSILGGAATGAGAVGTAALLGMSDVRLKTRLRRIRRLASGLWKWGWRWKWDAAGAENFGVIAQEALGVRPDAVVTTPDGALAINYGVLDEDARTREE